MRYLGGDRRIFRDDEQFLTRKVEIKEIHNTHSLVPRDVPTFLKKSHPNQL